MNATENDFLTELKVMRQRGDTRFIFMDALVIALAATRCGWKVVNGVVMKPCEAIEPGGSHVMEITQAGIIRSGNCGACNGTHFVPAIAGDAAGKEKS